MSNKSLRLLMMTAGFGFAVLSILLVCQILEQGSTLAVLLIGWDSPDEMMWPFPLSFQNFMIVMFWTALADTWARRMRATQESSVLEALSPAWTRLIDSGFVNQVMVEAKKINQGTTCFAAKLGDKCLQSYLRHGSREEAHALLRSLTELRLNEIDHMQSWSRYSALTITNIGFLGTVVGLSGALSFLSGGLDGDMTQTMQAVTNQLAFAFDTTVIGLVLSSVLSGFIQSIQTHEEQAINQVAEEFLCNIINRLPGDDHAQVQTNE